MQVNHKSTLNIYFYFAFIIENFMQLLMKGISSGFQSTVYAKDTRPSDFSDV
jgi:hypothetical protein